jgi:cytochrome c biogenesis protein CcdA
MKTFGFVMRMATYAMVLVLWWIGLFRILPLAEDLADAFWVVSGLIILTGVHISFTVHGALTEKSKHHENRMIEGPGSREQMEAHEQDLQRTRRFERVSLVFMCAFVILMIAYRFIILR